MKSIELTKEQKDKLLEMSNDLFPEYKQIEFEKSGMINLFKTILTPTKNYDYIHWFEFCMTHLVEKILNPKPNKPERNLKDKFEKFFWQSNLYANGFTIDNIHPVDYLWKIYKSNKKIKT